MKKYQGRLVIALILVALAFLISPFGIAFQFALSNKFGLEKYRLVLATIRFAYKSPKDYHPRSFDDPLSDQFKMSLKYLDERILSDPTDYEALAGRADMYFIADRFECAIRDYNSALDNKEKHKDVVCGCIFSEKRVKQRIQLSKVYLEAQKSNQTVEPTR